ncbi:hypothetical protein IEQ34_012415 [Dendrobium chrysotoxum]|uniref:Uncharacterized protein n=1 Tax=Dendrobium chrysotoxum TaxID=161865 RepID=A0AAV7GSD7_DENCH|nr:hypothetical protein IEQ34_012415 [Dendrobium chrysotoxum]
MNLKIIRFIFKLNFHIFYKAGCKTAVKKITILKNIIEFNFLAQNFFESSGVAKRYKNKFSVVDMRMPRRVLDLTFVKKDRNKPKQTRLENIKSDNFFRFKREFDS